ncbi:acid phosphatase, partial [Phenoliferia sp. Uapishka_3]
MSIEEQRRVRDASDGGGVRMPTSRRAINPHQSHFSALHPKLISEKAPVRKRLAGFGDIPPIFALCATGRQFSTAVRAFATAESDDLEGRTFEGSSNDDTNAFQFEGREPNRFKPKGGKDVVKGRMEVRRLSEDQGEGNTAIAGGSADCYWGELTDLGRQSTLTLGARLRALYVDQLHFLPSTLPDLERKSSPVAFRSTGMPRTIESLHQIVQGIFPTRDGPVEYVVRNAMDESLYPNSLCARMRKIDRASAEQAAKTYNPTLAVLDPLLSKYINGGPVRIDGHPRANGLLDTIMVCKAHGIKVPSEFEDPAVLQTLETAVVHEWFDGFANPEFRKLAMGRLLGDLTNHLERKAADPKEKTEKLRLAVYSCHDTSLGGILNALNVFDSRWPPFTSHIAFELFRPSPPPTAPSTLSSFLPSLIHAAPASPYYVRMRYNGKPVSIPSCRKEGMHLEGSDGEVCTLDGFREAVSKVKISAKEWDFGCAV